MKGIGTIGKRSLLVAASGAVLVCALGFGTLAYGIWLKQWDAPIVRRVAAATGFPAARVGNRYVRYADYLEHLDAEKQFLSGDAAKEQGLKPDITTAVKENALHRAMRIAAVESFAGERNIVVTPLDIDHAFEDLAAQNASSTSPDELRFFLKTFFGWEEKEFKQYVVRPALLEDLLNARAYRETNDLEAFKKELEARLAKDDVVEYLKFGE